MVILNDTLELQGSISKKYIDNTSIDFITISLYFDKEDIELVSDTILQKNGLYKIECDGTVYYNYVEIAMFTIDYDPNLEKGDMKAIIQAKQGAVDYAEYQSLLSQIEELENCILEMSEILYGDGIDDGTDVEFDSNDTNSNDAEMPTEELESNQSNEGESMESVDNVEIDTNIEQEPLIDSESEPTNDNSVEDSNLVENETTENESVDDLSSDEPVNEDSTNDEPVDEGASE